MDERYPRHYNIGEKGIIWKRPTLLIMLAGGWSGVVNSRTVEKRGLGRRTLTGMVHPRKYLGRPVLTRSDCKPMILLQNVDMNRSQTCFFRDVFVKAVSGLCADSIFTCSAADYLSDFYIPDVSLFHCCSFNHWKSERGRQPTKNNTPWSTRKISRDKVSVSSKYYFRF